MKISSPQQIHIEDYNYNLSDEKIAKYPLEERDSSKLLVCREDGIKDCHFSDLAGELPASSLLVFNNTKVIQARLHFSKETGAQTEIFCLEPHIPNDYILNFQQTQSCSWICLIGNLKKWKEGKLTKSFTIKGQKVIVVVERTDAYRDAHVVEFSWKNPSISFSDILESGGELPIPPYLNRDTEEKDEETYQTVYSKIKGSVAAPTAGLHFTDRIFDSLHNNGFETDEVTLHVGAGTFKPVKAEQIKDHEMHSEFISVRKEFIEHLLKHKGKVIAVGTTSVRTLESLYHIGLSLEFDNHPEHITIQQWQPYNHKKTGSDKISKQKALQNIVAYLDKHNLSVLMADTQIMIAPSYEFMVVDGIITNFHQPKSTLLLLVSAFVADGDWKKIYTHALNHNYRFLSYGDSSLLLK